MKKLCLFISCTFILARSFPQIPNSGFELWDSQPVPLLWETNSRPLTLPPYDPYIVKQDADSYAGNFAANFHANGFLKAYAKTTFPISAHPLNLSLYYKLSFAPCVNDNGYPQKDTVSVLVEVLNGNAVVDQGYWERTSTSFIYSQLVIPISQNASVFDSCRITIRGGKVFGGCGIIAAPTEFLVDELELQYQPACNTTGIVTQGVSCLLIDTGGSPLLMPCNTTLPALGFSAGDTIQFSFTPNPGCISFCLQGSGIDITCIDTSDRTNCNVSVSLQKKNPTSYVATNGSLRAIVTGATLPLFFVWSNNVSGIGVDSIDGLGEGNYCVTISDANNCTATACDSLAGAHICIDSALICAPGSLCCDAPLFDPVCGCDGVTYTNGCVATLLNGVTSYTTGPCNDSCHAGFYFTKHIDTVTFYDMSTSLSPIASWVWDFGDGNSYNQQNPAHVYPDDSTYITCLTITTSSGCTDQFCDTVFITHNCIDSTLLCGFPLCCDFAPMIPVCGCDSITYPNACEAEGFYGVASYYVGTCVVTGIKNGYSINQGIYISPNPAKDVIHVLYETARSGKTEIRITNILGQEMKYVSRAFEVSGKHNTDVNVNDLAKGVYFVEVKTETDRKLKKFAVE